jgi:hypothetical protein
LPPTREGCFKPGSKSKTYSARLVPELYQEQMSFEGTDQFKLKSKRRSFIEHKNAELKRYHGLARAKYRGLSRIRMQAILTAFVVNAKRMTKILNEMQPASGNEGAASFAYYFRVLLKSGTFAVLSCEGSFLCEKDIIYLFLLVKKLTNNG